MRSINVIALLVFVATLALAQVENHDAPGISGAMQVLPEEPDDYARVQEETNRQNMLELMREYRLLRFHRWSIADFQELATEDFVADCYHSHAGKVQHDYLKFFVRSSGGPLGSVHLKRIYNYWAASSTFASANDPFCPVVEGPVRFRDPLRRKTTSYWDWGGGLHLRCGNTSDHDTEMSFRVIEGDPDIVLLLIKRYEIEHSVFPYKHRWFTRICCIR